MNSINFVGNSSSKRYVLIAVVVLATACKAGPPTTVTPAPTAAVTAGQLSAYPGMTPTPANSYPALASQTPDPKAIAMRLDLPLKAGATTVTGNAPAGIVVSIQNITTMGDELGSGVVGPDNRFTVTVVPLEANVRLGLFVKDVGSSGKNPDDFNNDAYKGPNPLMVPSVGYYQDTASVTP
jgi:hypothetical protein